MKLKQKADYRRATWQTKESKNEINQLKTKLKYKPESRTKAECQLRNKAKKKKGKNGKRKKKIQKSKFEMKVYIKNICIY